MSANDPNEIIAKEVDERVQQVIDDLVRHKLQLMQRPQFADQMKDLIDQSVWRARDAFDQKLNDYIANEIGNRLRCGIYDGTKLDRLFQSIWTPQLDVAIKERIRKHVLASVEEMVADVFAKVRTILKG